MQQITIKNLEKPKQKDITKDIHWICDSFGLSAGRDIESTSIKIVTSLLERFAEYHRVSSEMLADDLAIRSAIINHHIRNLMVSGLLYREKKLILLRGGSLRAAVEEIRKDANRILDEIEFIAGEIDDSLGLKNRE